MSSAPGMAPPPGVQQANAAQANRPSGIPHNFQAPPNMPNINFNAPVIRLGTTQGKSGAPTMPGRKDSDMSSSAGNRPGLGMDRGSEQSRSAARENMQALVPPTYEEKLRTIFIHKIPEGAGDDGIEKLLNAVGNLRKWDPAASMLADSKGLKFGFAQFEDVESLCVAVEVLKDVKLPVKRQSVVDASVDDDPSLEKIESAELRFTVDPATTKYIESYKDGKADDSGIEAKAETARESLNQIVKDLYFPRSKSGTDQDGDVSMANAPAILGEDVEVVNIPLAQEDELADIPAEMREVVAAEIAAFRERSNKRDLERLKREEELEERERERNGTASSSHQETSQQPGVNNIPLGPRGVTNAPSGPRGQNGAVRFVNGGVANAEYSINREDDDTDASDDELQLREAGKLKSDEDKMYLEAERKWVNRERSRAAALDREKEREKADAEGYERRRQEQLEREKAWDDDREASRKTHLYHRDHAAWVRKRAMEKSEEEARDEADRKAEESERRREEAEMEHARGMADSFLDQQAHEMEQRQQANVAAPQPFKLSLGAAAQRAQAQRAAPQRRTIAEVEGLLDDEEQEQTVKRQLIPIQFEPTSTTSAMSDEDITNAVRALAQEIPSEKTGLWGWTVQWDYMDDSVIREKLRPFVEKKIVEYLGVQEQMLVEVVEEHLRKHGQPGELVDELAEVGTLRIYSTLEIFVC
jgi:hypothetical protein